MLSGKIICVTGAGGGLGREIALALHESGAQLILTDIDQKSGMETLEQIRSADGDGRFHAADLSKPDSIRHLAENISSTEGKLDGLVNNGAIATGIGGKSLYEIDIDIWDRVMAVNVRGLWLVTRFLAPLLRNADSPRIVNIASDTAIWGAPKLLAYVASKGAVISMTRSLAREMGADGIGVTAVAPGILTTQSTEYVPEERHQFYNINRAVPGPQGAEDIVGTVAFLLSEAALALSGQVLPANRGLCFT